MGFRLDMGSWEDHGDLVAADLVELLLGDFQKVLAVINDLSGLGEGIGRLDAQDGLGGNGLTGAGLAHDRQGLALCQVEIDATDSLNLTVAGTEGDPQVSYLQFRFH